MYNLETVRGRCVAKTPGDVRLQNQYGICQLPLDPKSPGAPFGVGDLLEVTAGRVQVLTPNRAAAQAGWMTHVLAPRRRKAIEMRGRVEAGIRDFFRARDFLETRTPLLVPSPGMEPHIRPFRVAEKTYLPTSPEFAMKRLLAGGLERIFQICPAFRDEPASVTHSPEFTMLEWYRAYAGYEEMMRDTETLFEQLAQSIFGRPSLRWQGREISVATPWPRLRVRDLFREGAGIDLVQCATSPALARECRRLGLRADDAEEWDDLYFKLWLNIIEPGLPADQAVFVTRYPVSQAALAVIDADADGTRWARRFEVYAGGLELANAFEELTDPVEQKQRFEKDMALRARVYGPSFPATPLDEGFFRALAEGIPPSGGIALGVDRLVMLFADEPEIAQTFWL